MIQNRSEYFLREMMSSCEKMNAKLLLEYIARDKEKHEKDIQEAETNVDIYFDREMNIRSNRQLAFQSL